MRRWLEISVVVPAGAADAVTNRLVEIGAPGVREEAVGDDRRLVAHFAEEAARPAVERMLGELEAWFPGVARAPIESHLVDEEDWADGWRQSFPPLEIGRRLRIRPPWEPPSETRVDVVIEPAMAFGTGQHASTHGCLVALEDALDRARDVAVLDVGTGSAILAIGALRLGAVRAVGVDTDPVAIASARENAVRNRVDDRLELVVGGIERAPGRFGLVLANLYSGVLANLMPELVAHVAPGGALVLSGILEADATDVADRAIAHGLTLTDERTIDGWTTLVLGANDGP